MTQEPTFIPSLDHEFPALEDFITFATAVKGRHKALVTIFNAETGGHRTYMFNRDPKSDTSPVFVSLLRGSDPENKRDYTFIGTIFSDNNFKHSPKSQVGADSPGVAGFKFTWERCQNNTLPEKVKVLHHGRCGRCGRLLTSPDSLMERRGIGPVCAEKLGLV